MTKRSKKSSTGSDLRRFAAATVVLIAAAAANRDASAQSLKLRSIYIPPQDLVGTWVSFHGKSQSGKSPVREFNQRLAIVSKEELDHGRFGLWVELKTTGDAGGTRIERGFFAPSSMRRDEVRFDKDGNPIDIAGEETPGGDPSLVLLRYQILTPGGKLYEYPVTAAQASRATGDVASLELFEYDPRQAPVTTMLGPDTLRLGRRVVPAIVERIRRYGSDSWQMDVGGDSVLYHLALTQTFWRNGAVPIAGYARSLFQAEMLPAPPPADSSAADSSAADSSASGVRPATDRHLPPVDPEEAAKHRTVLAWTELTFVDLGADAVPEITQVPELAPDYDEPVLDPNVLHR